LAIDETPFGLAALIVNYMLIPSLSLPQVRAARVLFPRRTLGAAANRIMGTSSLGRGPMLDPGNDGDSVPNYYVLGVITVSNLILRTDPACRAISTHHDAKFSLKKSTTKCIEFVYFKV
jgi:hypothetical protein